MGNLNSHEKFEIDAFERFSCVLDIVHSRARRALKKRRSAS
jgi:hypothetical protein